MPPLRLHIIEDEDRFPPLVEHLDNDDTVCLDSPFMNNLGLGDQIQVFPDLETHVFIVVDVRPAPYYLDGYKYVTLRNVFAWAD